jgi:DNA-binding beta-propeller fold protein YncE
LPLALAALLSTLASAHATLNTGENAVDVLGQFNSPSVDTTPDYVKGCVNDGASPYGFNQSGDVSLTADPGGVIDATNHRLFVADAANNRVLVFTLTSGNLISSKTPANVLGQPDFLTCAVNSGGNSGQATMDAPGGMDFDATNNRLFVADTYNDRVLVFSTSTITNGMNASYELGETSFTTAGTGTGGCATPGQATLCLPTDVKYDSANNRVFVVDNANNRVMVFSTSSITNGENAANELGQPSGTAFTSATAATTQSGLHSPNSVVFDSTDHLLYVADGANNRVLSFSTSSITNGENAANELGQPSGTAFTSNTAVADPATQSGMSVPVGLAYDSANSRLFVVDQTNNRVMVFSTSALSNGENASYVIGQWTFTGSAATTTQSSFNEPQGIFYDSTNALLYVVDQNNNRVTEFDVSATIPTMSSPVQSGFDACGIASGQLYCWGYNIVGEDGLGTSGANANNAPVQVGAFTNWTSASQSDPAYDGTGGYDAHDACGIAGGALYCWGENAKGELGLGNTTAYTTPQQVGSDTTWTVIRANSPDSCGIDNSKLYCWGLNQFGELGLGNTTQYTTPQQVGAATNWTAISQSGDDACGIAGGALYCWGHNSEGEVGNGNTTQQTSPVHIGALTTWTVISQGITDTCGIAGGALYCWGYNQYGELGIGNTIQKTTPTQVGTDTTWTAISIQNDGSDPGGACGIDNGKLYCWGQNTYGELGLGNTTSFKTPQQVGSATNWTAVSFGGTDACGIAGGQLYCWGYNNQGEVGVGTQTEYNSPQAVSGLADIGNGESATDLLGQYTSASSTATVVWTNSGQNNGPNALGFIQPADVAVDAVNHYLYVADSMNNRVLVYTLNADNSIPASSGGHTATYVLGQTSLRGADQEDSGGGVVNQSGMTAPQGLAVDPANQRLFVSDTDNCRVLVFSTSSLSNGMNASYVLGHANFGTGCGGSGSQSAFKNSEGLAYDAVNTRLFVVDGPDNRVLVFNVPTGTNLNGENANTTSGVLGQTTFAAHAAAHTAVGMDNPAGVAYDPVNSRLFVADQTNNRVTVYNVAPGFTNGESASFELGQPSGVNAFTTHAAATTQSGMDLPDLISYDPNTNRLFVADNINSRVLVYNVGPSVIANGENASYVIGAANFTTNNDSTTQSTLELDEPLNNSEACARYDPASGRLFVCDTDNNRVMIFEGSAIGTNPNSFILPGYE